MKYTFCEWPSSECAVGNDQRQRRPEQGGLDVPGRVLRRVVLVLEVDPGRDQPVDLVHHIDQAERDPGKEMIPRLAVVCGSATTAIPSRIPLLGHRGRDLVGDVDGAVAVGAELELSPPWRGPLQDRAEGTVIRLDRVVGAVGRVRPPARPPRPGCSPRSRISPSASRASGTMCTSGCHNSRTPVGYGT